MFLKYNKTKTDLTQKRVLNLFKPFKGGVMYKFLLAAIASFALAAGCSPQREVVSIISGTPGADGANGHSLVSQYQEVTGCECDEQGGSRLDIYLDLDDSLGVSEGDVFQNSLIACNGRNGMRGPRGYPGVQGEQGIPGEAGPQGIPGEQGIQGLPGPQGLVGATGAVGPQGIPGLPGPTGATGATGPQGAMGPQGPTGPAGALLQNYTLGSSCTSIGDGYYAKRDDTTVKLFKDLPGNSGSDCDSSGSDSNFVANIYAEHTSNGEASFWLTATRLAFNDNNGNLRVIKFN